MFILLSHCFVRASFPFYIILILNLNVIQQSLWTASCKSHMSLMVQQQLLIVQLRRYLTLLKQNFSVVRSIYQLQLVYLVIYSPHSKLLDILTFLDTLILLCTQIYTMSIYILYSKSNVSRKDKTSYNLEGREYL